MDIVDAQVHANVLGTEATLAVMDALGIQGLLFDEYQTTTEDGALQPGYPESLTSTEDAPTRLPSG
jgi:L-fuconolactonase